MTASRMQGKTVVVTGANSGIGFETAAALAGKGARVLLHARNRRRGEEALARVRRRSGSDDAELLLADLSSMQQVCELAKEIEERCDRLDVLINNAGLMQSRRSETEDGFETTLAVNHLAPFLLTHRLRDLLVRSAPARIVNVASDAHFGGRLDLSDLQSRLSYRGFRVYSTSKLANVLFTRELARRLEGTGVATNALHPGVVRSGFGGGGDASFPFSLGFALARPFMIGPRQGARTSIYLASSNDVEGVTGEYFARCRRAPISRSAKSDELARDLWRESERLLERWL